MPPAAGNKHLKYPSEERGGGGSYDKFERLINPCRIGTLNASYRRTWSCAMKYFRVHRMLRRTWRRSASWRGEAISSRCLWVFGFVANPPRDVIPTDARAQRTLTSPKTVQERGRHEGRVPAGNFKLKVRVKNHFLRLPVGWNHSILLLYFVLLLLFWGMLTNNL